MIAPLALSLALAFWAPYTPDHEQPCLPSLHYYERSTALPAEAVDSGITYDDAAEFTAVSGGCDTVIWLRADIGTRPIEVQCGILAHGLGHAVFGLGHSDDPRSVMNLHWSPPGACYPPTPPRYKGDRRCRVRWWRGRTPVAPSKCPKGSQLWDQDGPVAAVA